MNLTRTDYLSTGIFSVMESEDGSASFCCLEHAYDITADGVMASSLVYGPKIPQGSYKCVRGIHQLEGMIHSFETFEITNVPYSNDPTKFHTNVLLHVGNVNADSSGCILIGLNREGDTGIINSRFAFRKFMELQEGIDSFTLTIN